MKEFLVQHCSIHGDSKTHRKALNAACKTPRENEFYCKICKGMEHKGSNYYTGKQHMKAVNVIEKYGKHLEAGDGVHERFTWKKELSYALKKHVMDDHAKALLLQPFKDEVDSWYKASRKSIQSSIAGVDGNGEESLLRLLLELRKLKIQAPQSKIRANDCNQYYSILNAIKNEEAPTVWLLEHNFSSAKDLLETTKGAKDDVLISDGFWIVQDNRKSMSISKRHTNLLKLLDKSENCRTKFERFRFGALVAPPNVVCYKRRSACNLHNFIMKNMALQLAMDDVMVKFIGVAGDIDVFWEALFSNIPSYLEILYDHDVDLDRHFDTEKLGFMSGQSLTDARASHLEVVCSDDYEEHVVEVYRFSNAIMDHIL